MLMVTQEEEQWLCAPEGRFSEISELPLKIPGMWAEDNSLGLAQNILPVVVEQSWKLSHLLKAVLHYLQGPDQNSKAP
jgi:hypothetical protein